MKWYNAEKGYGAIDPDDGGAEVFVHHTAINASGFRNLDEGQAVEFEVTNGTVWPSAPARNRAGSAPVTRGGKRSCPGSGFGGGRVGSAVRMCDGARRSGPGPGGGCPGYSSSARRETSWRRER
ncbi:cold shock domain-containing protein [Streptomyces sp. McG3]|uniref:cold shock domain-containing protein n=1 Tax=Streptomyces sp. McG3 TaxID=2725483 RepID=UPI0027E544CD|nr:cold shock domain-containing protein [Streptomyces sp. McG3]MBT2898914.1 cold shock domain-containing protein [Streptomyces sp. McG3]